MEFVCLFVCFGVLPLVRPWLFALFILLSPQCRTNKMTSISACCRINKPWSGQTSRPTPPIKLSNLGLIDQSVESSQSMLTCSCWP